MSIFDKFPFLEGLPENEYDSTFREHVPDLETLLTYDVFVEFTQVKLPDTMDYMQGLQYELRRLKRRGSQRESDYPDAAYIKRMDELFPLSDREYNYDIVNFADSFIDVYKDYSCAKEIKYRRRYSEHNYFHDYEEEYEDEEEEITWIDVEHKYRIKRYNERDDDYVYDRNSWSDGDYDDYEDGGEHWTDKEPLSDKIKRYMGYIENMKDRTVLDLEFLLRGIIELIERGGVPENLETLLLCAAFLPYVYHDDCTKLMHLIYAKDKNLAIRIMLYPSLSVFHTTFMNRFFSNYVDEVIGYKKIEGYGDFLRMDAKYVKKLRECVNIMFYKENYSEGIQNILGRRNLPKYLYDESPGKPKFYTYNILSSEDVAGIEDDKTFMRIYPNLDTLIARIGESKVEQLVNLLKSSDRYNISDYARYNVGYYPHFIKILMEYWTAKEWKKKEPGLYDYGDMKFIEHMYRQRLVKLQKKYRFNVQNLSLMYENGTMKFKNTVPVDPSLIEYVREHHNLPTTDDYRLLASIMEIIAYEKWFDDLSAVSLFKMLPYTETEKTRRVIIEMIYEREPILGLLLIKFAHVRSYSLIRILKFAEKNKYNKHYYCNIGDLVCIFKDYWSIITTSYSTFESYKSDFTPRSWCGIELAVILSNNK